MTKFFAYNASTTESFPSVDVLMRALHACVFERCDALLMLLYFILVLGVALVAVAPLTLLTLTLRRVTLAVVGFVTRRGALDRGRSLLTIVASVPVSASAPADISAAPLLRRVVGCV